MNAPDQYDRPPVKRLVVKVGSNVLTARHGLNMETIFSLSRQISLLMDQGLEVVLVTSGAMAAGIRKIRLDKRPDEIPKRQAIAAVGQPGLMLAYEMAFGQHERKVAQILLTGEDLCSRKRYLNARNTLNVLLSWRIVPIINENDTVAVESIQFGDNDNLSAMIALLMDADLLINLTDIDGLYDRDPRAYPEANLVPNVSTIGKDIERWAGAIPGALGTGGMSSKIKAARKVTSAGIPMIIAGGSKPDILLRLIGGETHGTFFVPKPRKLACRKCWIAFNLKPAGALFIDQGAARAIVDRGKSLLPSGITGVDGEFGVGAAVACKTVENLTVGIGLVNYSAADIRAIKGLKTTQIQDLLGSKPYDEVIHRDNLAITVAGDA
jgi:glutamate 5-kinase